MQLINPDFSCISFMIPEGPLPPIPTLGKAQLPRGFSYPLGASAIGEVMISVPQYEKFTLSFSNQSPLLHPPLRIPGYPVIRFTYSNYPTYTPRAESVTVRPRRQGGERWHFDILPVLFEKRQIIQPLLISTGLPLLRDWLMGPDSPAGKSQRMAVSIWYFEDTGVMKLHVEEPV
jgi:hypothetical protein